MDMELRHYSYFVALAEELHFAKAAERCGISQPALSQQIRALEERLGASLMSRSRRHLELTEVGKVFYTQAVAVLRQADAAQSAIVEAAQGKAGRVAIGYVASAALSGVLPGIVYQYRQTRPDIELVFHQMDMEEQLDAVAKGQCDVGFIRPPIAALPDGVTLFDVLREPVLVALRSNHRCAGNASIRLADLKDDTFICVHRKEGIGFYDITMTVCRAAGFVPQVEVMSSQISIVISMVAAGFGVAIVPASTRTFVPPDVVFRPIEGNDVMSALSMIHAYNNHSPAVQMFAKTARDWARSALAARISGGDQATSS
jgi:DNA-binding transcriptional LysR family regulator